MIAAPDLQGLIREGEELAFSLEQGTLSCLGKLQALGEEEVNRYVTWRHNIIISIQNVDSRFTAYQQHSKRSKEEVRLFAEFNGKMSRLMQRVIMADGLLLALAEEKQRIVKAELAALSKGRRALNGYSTRERSKPFMNCSA
jgi:hypothetical protein